jgi:DNA-directed RNA polymerase subunit M/transcription elongation factor TFIIS
MKLDETIKELQALEKIERMQGMTARANIHKSAVEQLTKYKQIKENPAPERERSAWIFNTRLSQTLGTDIMTCLKCGNNVERDDISEKNYCSKCGAKMDWEGTI